MNQQSYCLDANVLIQAWQSYYSPDFCPLYWQVLNDLGVQKRVFIPQMVYNEVADTEDDLGKWLKKSKIPIDKIDGNVTEILKQIYAANESHKYLVDNTKQRSLADPWLIAHAIKAHACVVTKEIKVTAANSNRIKIPNVCDNMNVRWINDFQLVRELKIKFSCKVDAKIQGELF
ncbi:DUF4411 family protein [Hymenobacter rubidus]|uniref:DUF4411 family protein n=1 Tax=Hymenobacter rubidus TaxID=1441626 RepID=UPI00191ED09E|nr:DUF4411 family protein [Hymenobacter rubidus]